MAAPVSAGAPAQEALAIANQLRAKAGCRPLKMEARLVAAAKAHAKDMALRNYFDHRGANGSSFAQRIKAQGFRFRAAAENIAAGNARADQTMQQWMGSAGHRRNLLDCRYEFTGIAVYYQADDRPLAGQVAPLRYYWVQEFATK